MKASTKVRIERSQLTRAKIWTRRRIFRFRRHEDLKMDLEMEPTKNPNEAWVENTRYDWRA